MARKFAALAFLAAALLACGQGAKKDEKKSFNAQAELAKVKAAHAKHLEVVQELRALRQELQPLRDKAKLSGAEEAQKQQLEAKIKEVSKKLDEVFTEDQNLLTGFLTTALNEAPQAPETMEGLKLYAEDAQINAQDFMEQAGDYARAIEVLETAKGYFEAVGAPVPKELSQLAAKAQSLRYLTKERFDQLKKGMSFAEVRAITGTPNFYNVKEHEMKGKKIITWLFPRADKEVAALYFQEGKLYAMKWNVKEGQ